MKKLSALILIAGAFAVASCENCCKKDKECSKDGASQVATPMATIDSTGAYFTENVKGLDDTVATFIDTMVVIEKKR
jgi:hypothetical protein